MILKYKIKFLSCLLVLSVLPALAVAQLAPAPVSGPQVFTVSDIRLEGLQRISATNVFALLNINVGDELTSFDFANIIRDIAASENFDDVELLREGNVLIIRLNERPTISDLQLDGNKLIPTEALLENMENAGLAIGQVFQPSTLDGMRLALQEQYVGQGRYGASVEAEVVEQARNRVALNININEGEASKIIHINVVGNTVFSDEELLDFFELNTSNWLSWLRKDDQYAREKIDGDIERLTSYYMDQGYINFEITSTQVSITPAKDEVYITINISEGNVYTINEVELAGDLVDSETLLRLMIQLREGQVFSQQLVTSTSEFMTQLLGNRGYFFAEVEGVPSINEQDQTVDVTFFVLPGNRTYVNRISFYGNTNTADEVLRREMRQMEGAPASNIALEQSKVRLEQLGYFAEVNYETAEVPGIADQIDVDFSVTEQLSGQIGGSIGYGQVQGLVLSANLQQANFLGTGKSIGVGVNTSLFQTNYQFNYFDPYYTIDGVSRGFGMSYTQSDYAELNLASYSTNQFSTSVTYGYPLGETQRLSFNFGFSNTTIDEGFGPVQEIKSSPELVPGINDYILVPARDRSFFDFNTGQIFPIADAVTAPIANLPFTAFNQNQGFLDRDGDKFNNFNLSITWSESTLNRGMFPTNGQSQSLSLEMAVPGSELAFYRLRYIFEKFIPVYGEWIVHLRTDLGYGDGYGSTEQLPFFQHFYAGGLGSVRGFERNTLGPRATFPERYRTSNTQFVRDANGNIAQDPFGDPVLDASSGVAYVLEQALDEEGFPLFDETGLPVLNQVIGSENLFSGRSSPFGGNVQTTGTLEMLFPLPFIEDRSRIRSAFFVDAGNVFSSYCTQEQESRNNCSGFDVGELRYSAGLSVSWFSGAFGIMSFSLAKPFNTTEIDETEIFQFTLGNTF
ncbi:MAG: outer membrane protein assembly factor BamA [Gammaproteobacteria bacterium]|nr:outer membrane protein assembly factor BamA [Gammaproteobacteria bacterium]